jgi:hypothetical protein
MIQYEGKTLLSTKEVCETLNKTTEAVRQHIYRKNLIPTRVQRRLYFDLTQVNEFNARRMGLPALETCESFQNNTDSFFTVKFVADTLGVAISYLRTLIKKSKLQGYVSQDGALFIPKSSFDKYMGVSDVADTI